MVPLNHWLNSQPSTPNHIMNTPNSISPEARRMFVESLQSAVAGTSPGRDIKELFNEHAEVFANQDLVELTVLSQDGDNGTLRVLQPTPSVVSAKIKGDIEPASVEFYLTRPAGTDTIETNLLGLAKYPNSDGSWSVRFMTDPGALGCTMIFVHAEVLGVDDRVLLIGAMEAAC